MNTRDRIKSAFRSIFLFSVPSTTTLTVLVYLAIFISSIIVYEIPPKAPLPSEQLGLNLRGAFRDLQVIAGAPHPYNSHANGQVRAHILSRVTEVSRLYNNVHVADDVRSNATWCSARPVNGFGGVGVYFEGDNILVKIDGRQSDLEAVLLSAHFDSVSTAPGATDDGMGVATLLQLVEYFAAHTPKRTVIFNINNGEEDGLHGAHVFLEHQWSSLPKTFLNLEGAGSGGRPILFRTSSTSVTRAFLDVAHPHGSVLSSDVFQRRLIRSDTDFSVYVTEGLQGLDFAFYRRRSFYHTKDDSVPRLGGADSLWNMMESSLESAIALTESASVSDSDDPPVYFDVYGELLAVFSLRNFFIINLILLIVGPLLVTASVGLVHAQGKLHWSLRGWVRFPLAFVLGSGLTIGLTLLFAHVNPNIVYSSGYTVAASLISIALIGLHGPLVFLSYWRPVPQQKSIVLLETYVVWWILLVCETVLVNKEKIGGLFFITFFHAGALLALIMTLLEHLRLPSIASLLASEMDAEDAEVADEEHHEEANQTETTPLIRRRYHVYKTDDVHEGNYHVFWILEYLLLVPVPAILTAGIYAMLLGALPQTLADGSSALTIYLSLAILSILLVFPVAPFAHNVHRMLPVVLLVILISTGLYNLFAFPFSTASPLKVFFHQSLDLDTGVNHVNLTGLAGFVDKKIIPDLPSTVNQTVQCSDLLSRGLRTCQWTGLAPAVVPNRSEWLTFDATLSGPGVAVISLKGVNTRSCRIYFDSPVTTVRVNNSTGEVQSHYSMPGEGITELRLWSRTWDREFVVTAGWEGETLSGRVACGWAENLEGRIPAFAEIVGFLPAWAEVTKANDALVEATHKFSL